MNVKLIMLKKAGPPKNISLPSSVTVLGRRHDCDLRIPLMSVSRRHCQLNHDNGVLKIRDLNSRNGTVINGKTIKETAVAAGDRMEIGPLKFLFQIDGKPDNLSDLQIGQEQSDLENSSQKSDDELFESLEDLDEDSPDASGFLGDESNQPDDSGSLPAEFNLQDDD